MATPFLPSSAGMQNALALGVSYTETIYLYEQWEAVELLEYTDLPETRAATASVVAASIASTSAPQDAVAADIATAIGAAPAVHASRTSMAPAFAAIDLGTNNCRLMIATPAGRSFRVLDSFSRIVRLGEGLQHSGALSDIAMDRTITALHGCARRLGRRELRGVRAVATEACRRASNGRSFLDRVRSETGLAIDVISSREEAELALESCAALLEQAPDGKRTRPTRGLLFDIGGGSTEIAWVRLGDGQHRRQQLIGYHSLPLGVITLADIFGAAMFEADGYDAMVDHVEAELRTFEQIHCIAREIRRETVRLVGTSGTVTTLASVAMRLPRYRRALVDGVSLSRDAACDAVQELREGGLRGLVRHGCVGPERATYVLPGCAIFEAIHRIWPTDTVTVADRGLRDGMLLRMMRDAGRHRMPRPGDIRIAAGEIRSCVV